MLTRIQKLGGTTDRTLDSSQFLWAADVQFLNQAGPHVNELNLAQEHFSTAPDLRQSHEPLLSSFAMLSGKIGILGASVDPVHNGHLDLARAAMRACGLDSVVIIPNFRNPLKGREPQVNPALRLQMVRESLRSHPNLYVSPIELLKGEPAFTSDTLAQINEQLNSDSKLYFICGSDNLSHMHLWKNADQIFEHARVIVVARAGESVESALQKLSEQHWTSDKKRQIQENFIEARLPELSSTQIREALARNEDVGGLIPEGAYRLIKQFQLYQPRKNLNF